MSGLVVSVWIFVFFSCSSLFGYFYFFIFFFSFSSFVVVEVVCLIVVGELTVKSFNKIRNKDVNNENILVC